jgi:hypothetical protein
LSMIKEHDSVVLAEELPSEKLKAGVYGFSAAEMRKIAQDLHAKAKEEMANRRGKKFRASSL